MTLPKRIQPLKDLSISKKIRSISFPLFLWIMHVVLETTAKQDKTEIHTSSFRPSHNGKIYFSFFFFSLRKESSSCGKPKIFSLPIFHFKCDLYLSPNFWDLSTYLAYPGSKKGEGQDCRLGHDKIKWRGKKSKRSWGLILEKSSRSSCP